MRNKLLITLLIFSIFACKKETLKAPTFSVSTEKLTYKVGDSIEFHFSGNADLLAFYSGENGKEYKFKDRVEVEDGQLGLNIKTRVLYGSQLNNLRLVYSTDFNNIYDKENVSAAEWADITDRFTLSTSAPGGLGVEVSSGIVDISDLVEAGKPIYFAFQYVGEKPAGTSPTQRTWRIFNFDLSNQLSDGTIMNISSIANAGWLPVQFENTVSKWFIQLSSNPPMYFNPNSTLEYSEAWVVSKAFFPNSVLADKAVGIKSYLDDLESYKYAYDKAGTYTVSFMATTSKDGEVKTSLKEITITITE